MRPSIAVEIWSDVVCPWCYIGKRRFDRAVLAVADEIDVTIHYRPYQLDPTASTNRATPVVEAYAKKFGGPERAAQIIDNVTEIASAEGIDFRLDRALRANTLLAHRLLWLADGLGVQAALKERLLSAYFTEGLNVGEPQVLADAAAEVGLDRQRTLDFLASDDGTEQVHEQLRIAAADEITAVPTYVFNSGWQVPGAQDTETFISVLHRVAARSQALR